MKTFFIKKNLYYVNLLYGINHFNNFLLTKITFVCSLILNMFINLYKQNFHKTILSFIQEQLLNNNIKLYLLFT